MGGEWRSLFDVEGRGDRFLGDEGDRCLMFWEKVITNSKKVAF